MTLPGISNRVCPCVLCGAGDEETGTRHFREALRFDPEHASAKESYKQVHNSFFRVNPSCWDFSAGPTSTGSSRAFRMCCSDQEHIEIPQPRPGIDERP